MSKARDLAGIFNLGPRSGTTAQRPATADAGDIYYNGTTGKTEIYTTTGWKEMASGIPFGNTAARPAAVTGQPYFNGETARLELYTGNSWENIVQEVPGVSSISGSYSEATDSGVITINGTNFVSGAYATAIGANGVQINAASTVYNSLVQLTATFTGLSNAQEPYDIKVTNPSNLFGLIPDALYINASPVWQTASGSLGSFYEQASITLSAVSASDSDSQTITYALANGSSLPSGLTLSSSGVISGTLPNISTQTTYSFTVNATDGVNVIPRSFSITSKVLPSSIEYLIVGGGGAAGRGGGASAGGGGAGGMLTGTFTALSTISNGTLITVGNGGAGRSNDGAGNSGQNSVALGLTAIGGGGGGVDGNFPALSGGSGGGGGTAHTSPFNTNGGAGTSGQGNSGGNGYSSIQVSPYSSGGGGGAGAAGSAGTSGGGGAGGIGLQSSITGTATYYAGGGSGGSYVSGVVAGSLGGGGASGNGNAGEQPGTSGTPNTGGGAGGSRWITNQTSASGGSGVVVLAYPDTDPAAVIPGTLTYDTPTRAGYRVYRFTAGSGTVTW